MSFPAKKLEIDTEFPSPTPPEPRSTGVSFKGNTSEDEDCSPSEDEASSSSEGEQSPVYDPRATTGYDPRDVPRGNDGLMLGVETSGGAAVRRGSGGASTDARKRRGSGGGASKVGAFFVRT